MSHQAVNILRAVKYLPDPDADPYDIHTLTEVKSCYLFRMPDGKTLSENALLNRCRKDKLGCVPHGFRSSFRDWSAEVSGARREAIELSLAHHVS